MDTTYWQDAKGRVYKFTQGESITLEPDTYKQITRAIYRKTLRERKHAPATDPHAQGESANESEG